MPQAIRPHRRLPPLPMLCRSLCPFLRLHSSPFLPEAPSHGPSRRSIPTVTSLPSPSASMAALNPPTPRPPSEGLGMLRRWAISLPHSRSRTIAARKFRPGREDSSGFLVPPPLPPIADFRTPSFFREQIPQGQRIPTPSDCQT